MLISAVFKIENHNYDLYLTGPYASFVGRIYEGVEQNENDCKFGVNLLKYNNFGFANKEKINFKIQVVYEAGPDSHFKKLAPKLQIRKLLFISGFFNLNENESPFIKAKEIDILDEFSDNSSQIQSNINLQSPFSYAHKFRNNKNTIQSSAKTVKMPYSKEIEIIDDDNINEQMDKNEEELVIASTSTTEVKYLSISKKPVKRNSNKRKMELADLSIQRLEKATKNTKVKTRSQRQNEKDSVQVNDNVLIEVEEST